MAAGQRGFVADRGFEKMRLGRCGDGSDEQGDPTEFPSIHSHENSSGPESMMRVQEFRQSAGCGLKVY